MRKSFLYRFVGIPTNWDEFKDKIKRKGDRSVDFDLVRWEGDSILSPVYVGVEARSKSTKLAFGRKPHYRQGNLLETRLAFTQLDLDAIELIAEKATELLTDGFEVTYREKPIDELYETARLREMDLVSLTATGAFYNE